MSLTFGALARLLTISVLTTLSFVTVAQARMSVQVACSGDHLSKMTAMVGGMPDGAHKWKMNRHLAMINTAMAQDGVSGCEKVMRKIIWHHHHNHHHHGVHGHKKMM